MTRVPSMTQVGFLLVIQYLSYRTKYGLIKDQAYQNAILLYYLRTLKTNVSIAKQTSNTHQTYPVKILQLNIKQSKKEAKKIGRIQDV